MTLSGNYSTVSFAPCLRSAKVAYTRPTVTFDLNIINSAAFRVTMNQELTSILISLNVMRFYLLPLRQKVRYYVNESILFRSVTAVATYLSSS